MTWLFTHLALICGFLMGFMGFVLLMSAPRRRGGIAQWLIWMILVPYVTLPLYLIFGGRKYRKVIREKGGIPFGTAMGNAGESASPFDRMLRHFGLPPQRAGNQITMIDDGVEAFTMLMNEINRATTSISIETFVLHPDPVGRAILAALTARAKDGVDVRLLLDGVGSRPTRKKHCAALLAAGGKVARFIPVLHLPFVGKTNTRNHRKIAIFDEQRVFAGGSNLAEEYMGPTPLADRWKDINFLMEGPCVEDYLAIFSSDWQFATRKQLPPPRATWPEVGHSRAQIVPSGPDIPSDCLYDVVLMAISGARDRCWIATPYFIPDQTLIDAICLASARGVDVRIIVPWVSNQRLADLARSCYLRDAVNASANVYWHTGGMFHGKTILVDQEFTLVGSMNTDRRSLFINFEVMCLADDPEVRTAVEDWNEQLMAEANRTLPSATRTRLFWEGIVRVIAPEL
ncbi:MAG: phospholipase D-like domain-containing protein [Phycisphaerales bacterium]|nr:phospholipase D-like domain-containing protein [Phycisphaerales bacterium]